MLELKCNTLHISMLRHLNNLLNVFMFLTISLENLVFDQNMTRFYIVMTSPSFQFSWDVQRSQAKLYVFGDSWFTQCLDCQNVALSCQNVALLSKIQRLSPILTYKKSQWEYIFSRKLFGVKYVHFSISNYACTYILDKFYIWRFIDWIINYY